MLAKNKELFGLFSLASFNFFLLGIQVISKEVSEDVSWIVFGFFVAVLVVQLAILALAARLTDNQRLKAGLAGLMLAGNIVAFYVAFFEKFLSFDKNQMVASFLILLLVCSLALYWSGRIRLMLKTLLIILTLNSVFVIGSIITYDPNSGVNNSSDVLSQYQKIKFKTKPNIHLVAFDSLQPAAVVKEHMGLTNLAYVKYMQQNSTIVKNFFSSGSPSKDSFNSQMRLADGRLSGDGYFAGRLDGPVHNVLKANGYRLETGFSEDYFGSKGAYVDEYIRLHEEDKDSIEDSTLCGLASHKEKILKLYGFCLIYGHTVKHPEEKEKKTDDWHQKVANIISAKAHSDQPWMTINYIFNPIGHTPVSLDGHDTAGVKRYIEVYDRKSQTDVPAALKKVVKAIQRDDPNSIVLIYGDHGPILSRHIPIAQKPSFNIPDRFAIFGAVYKNNNPCSNINNINHYQQGYLTIERLVAGIFRCLAKDPTTVDKAVNFKEEQPFGKYLYDN